MLTFIKGYEGRYSISEDGSIVTHMYRKRGCKLNPGSNKGYPVVVLTDENGVRKTFFVHRLVAQTFLPNPNHYRCVNHRNEIKTDNRVENLEWCTDQYNKEYSSKVLYVFKSPTGERVETKNMSRFCRENNLLQGNVSKLVAGDRKFHRGWSLF